MAAIDTSALLGKRQAFCASGEYYSHGYCYSGWQWYGRWIFAAVVIVVILAIFFLWACLNSRRRRRSGLPPRYGTGWMGGNNPQHNNPQGYYQQGYNNPPPAYGQGQSYPMQNQYTGTTFQTGDGYYGQHEGIHQPKDNGLNDIAPPAGPPPAKIH